MVAVEKSSHSTRLASFFSWRRFAALAFVVVTALSAVAVFSALVLVAPAHTGEFGNGSTVPKLLFGIGPEADAARQTELARSNPVGMLTSWYTGPKDLGWLSKWKTSEV